MLRAIRLATVVASLLAFLPASPTADPQAVKMINGIGLIDYSREPKLDLGSWVRYRITGSSELGMVDDYEVTVLIAGEEQFWGEDCFWVETWTQPKDGAPNAVATLMSYAIFGDSLAVKNLQLYSRKTISQFNEDGSPAEVVTKRNTGSMTKRGRGADKVEWHLDTLDAETVTVPRGTFDCQKILVEHGIGSTADMGDSSQRTEVRETRTIFMSKDVPLTGIVREDIDYSIKRKAWKIGYSQEAGPLNLVEHSRGSGLLVDFGKNLTPQVLPVKYRKKLADYRPTSRPASAKTRTVRRKAG